MNQIKENIALIQSLMEKSNGKPITYGKNEYQFVKVANVAESQIADFENAFGVIFPEDYRHFLLEIGACSLLVDEILGGYDFMQPIDFQEYAKQVFENTGCDFFPKIVFVADILPLGVSAGFIFDGKATYFGQFYHDTPPEFWAEEAEKTTFTDWLTRLLRFYQEEVG